MKTSRIVKKVLSTTAFCIVATLLNAQAQTDSTFTKQEVKILKKIAVNEKSYGAKESGYFCINKVSPAALSSFIITSQHGYLVSPNFAIGGGLEYGYFRNTRDLVIGSMADDNNGVDISTLTTYVMAQVYTRNRRTSPYYFAATGLTNFMSASKSISNSTSNYKEYINGPGAFNTFGVGLRTFLNPKVYLLFDFGLKFYSYSHVRENHSYLKNATTREMAVIWAVNLGIGF